MKDYLRRLWQENRSFIVFMILMSVFRSALADWNEVPTGSMKPTILEGDRILVNKMAYDLRLPFTHFSMLEVSEPQRGDIVVFDSRISGKRLVKRVIGVPGDTVELVDNVLHINGERLDYATLGRGKGSGLNSSVDSIDRREDLLGVEHVIRLKKQGSRLSSFAPVKVPQNSFLAMGDNRDNSADSRVIGFVPRNEIVGRARQVIVSLDYDNYYLPRSDRYFHTL